MNLATAHNDRDTAPDQEVVDQTPDIRITTDPAAWFPALNVGPYGSAALVIVLIRKWW